jgi:hypothetical protein
VDGRAPPWTPPGDLREPQRTLLLCRDCAALRRTLLLCGPAPHTYTLSNTARAAQQAPVGRQHMVDKHFTRSTMHSTPQQGCTYIHGTRRPCGSGRAGALSEPQRAGRLDWAGLDTLDEAPLGYASSNVSRLSRRLAGLTPKQHKTALCGSGSAGTLAVCALTGRPEGTDLPRVWHAIVPGVCHAIVEAWRNQQLRGWGCLRCREGGAYGVGRGVAFESARCREGGSAYAACACTCCLVPFRKVLGGVVSTACVAVHGGWGSPPCTPWVWGRAEKWPQLAW